MITKTLKKIHIWIMRQSNDIQTYAALGAIIVIAVSVFGISNIATVKDQDFDKPEQVNTAQVQEPPPPQQQNEVTVDGLPTENAEPVPTKLIKPQYNHVGDAIEFHYSIFASTTEMLAIGEGRHPINGEAVLINSRVRQLLGANQSSIDEYCNFGTAQGFGQECVPVYVTSFFDYSDYTGLDGMSFPRELMPSERTYTFAVPGQTNAHSIGIEEDSISKPQIKTCDQFNISVLSDSWADSPYGVPFNIPDIADFENLNVWKFYDELQWDSEEFTAEKPRPQKPPVFLQDLAKSNPKYLGLFYEYEVVEDCAGFWLIRLFLRPMKVITADITNISDEKIYIDEFNAVEQRPSTDFSITKIEFSSYSETTPPAGPSVDDWTTEYGFDNSDLESNKYDIFAKEILPGQTVSIPVLIILDHLIIGVGPGPSSSPLYNDFDDLDEFITKGAQEKCEGTEHLHQLDATTGNFERRQFFDEGFVGAWYQLLSITGRVGQVRQSSTYNFRQFNLRKTGFHDGVGRGSCPFVYVKEGDDWVQNGTIISNQNGKALEGGHVLRVKGVGDGAILIREEEDEVSYLDYVALEFKNQQGERVVVAALNSPDAMRSVDGRYFIMEKGDELHLNFGSIPAGAFDFQIVSSGYFEPIQKDPDPLVCVAPN